MKQFVAALALLSVAWAQEDYISTGLRAVTRLSGSHDLIQGNITFTQLTEGKVRVEGTILGLNHGQYGFHVHEKGDITNGCISTGAHFNPENKNHGHPEDVDRHVGDLGNIEFDENKIARIDIVDGQISLVGPHSIIGRAVVLHEKSDDYGRSASPDSKKTGNAGGRVACGVIGILDPNYGWRVNAATPTLSSTALALSVMGAYFVL